MKYDEFGTLIIKADNDARTRWETLHLYLWILKWYYTLHHILVDASESLKSSA